mgnify:CR=1 FL=1
MNQQLFKYKYNVQQCLKQNSRGIAITSFIYMKENFIINFAWRGTKWNLIINYSHSSKRRCVSTSTYQKLA